MRDVYVIGAGQTPSGATPGESYRSLFEAAYDRAVESVPAGLDPGAVDEAVVGDHPPAVGDRVEATVRRVYEQEGVVRCGYNVQLADEQR